MVAIAFHGLSKRRLRVVMMGRDLVVTSYRLRAAASARAAVRLLTVRGL